MDAYPTGMEDSFAQYMDMLKQKQQATLAGQMPAASGGAPRQIAMANPGAPRPQGQGPLTQTGQGMASTAGNELAKRGTNSLVDYLVGLFKGGGAGSASALSMPNSDVSTSAGDVFNSGVVT